MLDNGQHLRLGVAPIRETRLETLREFTDHIEIATNEACSALQRAADDMVHFYDVHHQHAPTYKVGDKVWLNAQNITTTQPKKKLDHKWLGSYTVHKVISQNAYGLHNSLPPLVAHIQCFPPSFSDLMKKTLSMNNTHLPLSTCNLRWSLGI